jgi:predicted phosphodiesterase
MALPARLMTARRTAGRRQMHAGRRNGARPSGHPRGGYRGCVAGGDVILVSDTHLSPAAPHAQANWDAVLGYVTAAAPQAVIHLGDLSLDGAHDPADLAYARRQLDRLPVPWHALPGNHDVGENQWPGVPDGLLTSPDRRQRWLDAIGPDYWSLDVGGWTLLAINAQLAGTGLAAEAAQWAWLAGCLAARRPGRPVALLTHKPLAGADAAETAAAPAYRFWPESARQRLSALLGPAPADLIASGHVHQHRDLHSGGTDQLWVPTTWAVLPDERQPVLGAKLCGLVSLDLASGRPPRRDFIAPSGITTFTLHRDIPDPYRH